LQTPNEVPERFDLVFKADSTHIPVTLFGEKRIGSAWRLTNPNVRFRVQCRLLALFRHADVMEQCPSPGAGGNGLNGRRPPFLTLPDEGVEMRIFVASLIVLSALYYWDDNYNNGKYPAGLRSMGRSISHNMGQ
jgi:hypothetical protein